MLDENKTKNKNIKIVSKLKPPKDSSFKLIDAIDVQISIQNILQHDFFLEAPQDLQEAIQYIDKNSLYFNGVQQNNILIGKSNNIHGSNMKLIQNNLNIDGGINTTGDINTDNDLHVTGNIYQYSDLNLKQNIQVLSNCLQIVNKLNPVTYNFKNNKKNNKKINQYGLIAQELEQVIPDLVIQVDGIKRVNYSKLIPFLIGAIQELSRRVK